MYILNWFNGTLEQNLVPLMFLSSVFLFQIDTVSLQMTALWYRKCSEKKEKLTPKNMITN